MEDLGVGIYKIIMAAYPSERTLYVGQSKYLTERIRTHRGELKARRHFNPHLQNVYNKHGLSGWRFEVICNCRIDELDALEQFYIDELKPECNILRTVGDLRSWWVPSVNEPPINSLDMPGLELDWRPQPWHRQVYGDGGSRKR